MKYLSVLIIISAKIPPKLVALPVSQYVLMLKNCYIASTDNFSPFRQKTATAGQRAKFAFWQQ